jgi:hypothetical protein
MNGVSWYSGFVCTYYFNVYREEGEKGLIYAEVIFAKVVICKFKSLSE